MTDEWTCGKGLAKNAALPAKLADVSDAMAGLLEAHTRALDVTHEACREEYDAYRRIAEDWRGAAPLLHAISTQMAGYKDLKMGPHDQSVMAGPEFVRAFERLVTAERELAAVLGEQLTDYGPMLDELKKG